MEQIKKASDLLKEAEIILIGAGAGASASAGLTYSGERFTRHFGEFIEKYGSMYMTDMYTAGFYPFPTQEAKWGYWSKHSIINRFLPPALPLYKKLYEIVKEKNYFVLTTNVDHQFRKAGFPKERIFATQGDYGKIQCERGCHAKIYDAEELFCQMDQARKDCLIPADLVPKCPVCGGNMTMHLRCDQYFVEDENWHAAAGRYRDFLKEMEGKRAVFLELGVGLNTPGIIKYPFWRMTAENPKAVYVCVNQGEAYAPEEIAGKSICIDGDIGEIVNQLSDDYRHINGTETADILLDKLKADSLEYGGLETAGYSLAEKKNAIRSLMNIRMPKKLSDELLNLQDRYLKQELCAKGIVSLRDIPTIEEALNSKQPYGDKISLWQGDITRLEIDAIVNAANSRMLGCFVPCHRCIDNAIHSAAGMQLREECNQIMGRRRLKYGRNYEEPTGTATLTAGYNLPCQYVIHTVGPIVNGRLHEGLCQDLRNCYDNVLQCCVEHHIKSVAFCCISTGEFHFPNDRAAQIAWETVSAFLERHGDDMERVVFNVFQDNDRDIYEKILG